MSTSNNTFGVTFFLKKQIKNQNGKSPLYARITVNGKRAVISVKQSIFPRNWNALRGMAKGNHSEIVQFNGFLERFRAGIVRSYQELLLERRTVTAELLKNRFIGADNSEHTIGELMDYHNQDQQMKLKWGTMKNYYATQNYLRGFLKEFYGTSDRYLSELNYQFISDFEHFLRSRSSSV